MNVPVVAHHQDVFVTVVGSDGKTSREIRRRPICFGDGAGPRPLSEGWVNRGKGGGGQSLRLYLPKLYTHLPEIMGRKGRESLRQRVIEKERQS